MAAAGFNGLCGVGLLTEHAAVANIVAFLKPVRKLSFILIILFRRMPAA